MHIELDGNVWRIVEFQHVKPGKGGAFVRTKLKALESGAVVEKTFRAGEKFSRVRTETKDMQYLYDAGDEVVFMDQDTFETLTLSSDALGEDRGLLTDNLDVQIHRYNGQPIGIVFPPHVELTVTNTEMGVRGNTASGSVTKSAVLETGMEIQVPLFIKEGERVKVHTETREFAGRA